jgi:rhodanese-related sulfurtransferase
MTVNVRTSAESLVRQAYAEIETIGVDEALSLHGRDDVVFVDIRDVRELRRDGRIPGAFHMPRGMAEFWIDPGSRYHKDVFDQDKRFVFFCAAGMRSALTVQAANRIGLEKACHFDGGFGAWKEKGGPIEKDRSPGPT